MTQTENAPLAAAARSRQIVSYGPEEIVGGEGRGIGLFHYCGTDASGRIAPVAYCSPFAPCPECRGACRPDVIGVSRRFAMRIPECNFCRNRGTVWAQGACRGHPDEATACEHYRQYVVDTATSVLAGKPSGVPCDVAGCGEPSAGFAVTTVHFPEPAFRMFACGAHLNKQAFAKLLPLVGRFTVGQPPRRRA